MKDPIKDCFQPGSAAPSIDLLMFVDGSHQIPLESPKRLLCSLFKVGGGESERW